MLIVISSSLDIEVQTPTERGYHIQETNTSWVLSLRQDIQEGKAAPEETELRCPFCMKVFATKYKKMKHCKGGYGFCTTKFHFA